MRAKLITPDPAVASVRVEVFQGMNLVETRTLVPQALPLPGGDQLGGDVFFTVRPGVYRVAAAAQDAAGAPVEGCMHASATAQVAVGKTTEVMLAIVCTNRGTGGLDAIVTVNSGPAITNLALDPSKIVRTCQPLTITATASDRAGGALDFSWAVTNAPAGARYALDPKGASATFTSETQGSFELHVSATSPSGSSTSLTFPVHVGMGAAGPCVRRVKSLDVRFAEVARRVPEFGGAYIGRGGVLNVVVTDTSAEVTAAAEAALRDVVGADRPLPGAVAFVQGQYNFDQLMAARVRARGVLGLPGVTRLGVSESKNRVKIGVADAAARRAALREVSRLGIDPGRVLVEIAPGPDDLQNTTKIRPVVGGTQIALNGGGTCTLGFVGIRNGSRGYLTNSHCTNNQGGVEGTTHAQADGADTIGTEIADPMYTTGGDCPSGRRCRWSDSSWALLDIGVTSQRGEVYKGSVSRYRVVAEYPFPIEGEILRKVGRTTGESAGEVTDTCEDTNNSKTNVTLYCQDYVAATVKPGDSGSPVMLDLSWLYPSEPNPVAAMGVLWGGPKDGSYFVFSAMWNIQHGTELSNLNLEYADNAPTIEIVKPVSGTKVNFGAFNSTSFEAKVDDSEGGPDCCTVTWSSSKDGALGTGKSITYVFASPGTRTITATAKDASGNTTSDTVTISTENIPPVVTIAKPTPGQVLWKGLPYALQAWAWDSETFSDLPCGSMEWKSSSAGDPFPAFGCTPQATFLTTGWRTLTVTATDAHGGTGKATRTFSVANPPTSAPPIVSILKPSNNSFFDASETVALVGTAQDTDAPAGTIMYRWILERGSQQTVLGTSSGPSGGQTTLMWKPANDVPFSCGGEGVTIILEATDAEGTSTDTVAIYVFHPVC